MENKEFTKEFEKQFVKELNEIYITQEGQNIMIDNIKSNNNIKVQPIKLKNIKYLTFVAIIPIFCVVAYASGVLVNVVDVFSPIFGVTPVQTQIINDIAYPIGASANSNGITITADAIIGDTNMATVVYTISNDDGTPIILDETLLTPAEEPINGWNTQYYFGFDRLQPNYKGEFIQIGTKLSSTASRNSSMNEFKTNSEGNLIFIEQLESSKLPKGKKVTAYFYDMGYIKSNYLYENGEVIEYNYEFIPMLSGEWEIEYRFDYVNTSKTIAQNKEFTHQDRDIKVNSIVISPLTLTIEFEYLKFESQHLQKIKELEDNQNTTELTIEQEKILDELNLEEMQIKYEFEESIPLYLTKNDGEIIKLSRTTSNSSTIGSRENTTTNSSVHFDEIISLEDIYSVTFGDIESIVS